MPLAAAFGAANFLGHMAYVSTLTHCLLFVALHGSTVVPFCPFSLGVSLLKPNIWKKGYPYY